MKEPEKGGKKPALPQHSKDPKEKPKKREEEEDDYGAGVASDSDPRPEGPPGT